MSGAKRILYVSSRGYSGSFGEDRYVWLVGEKWLTVQRKDGKWKLSIPREALDYLVETEE